jgi:hypothetical protein
MNNSGIKKINTAGLIGYIVCILLIVCSVSCMVVTAIGTAAAIAVSKENVSARVSTNIDISSTGNFLEKLNKYMNISGVENLSDLITEDGETVKVNDRDVSEVTVAKNEGGSFSVGVKTNEITFSTARIIASLVVSFIFLGAVTVMLHLLKALMKSLKTCETPFADDVIRNMTRFANSLIPVVVLNMLCGGLWNAVTRGAEIGLTVNLGSVLVVAVIYLLVIVFRYGAQLQKESDETL